MKLPVLIDLQTRELTVKLVYYGPALSGKTTNLQAMHKLLPVNTRQQLMTLETRDDRTLFFDVLPLAFKVGSGLSVKIKLFTVPGQVIHNATRRIVLQGVDGIAYIADSRKAETKRNAEANGNLKENLREHKLELSKVPLVIQFNKRDLPDARPDAEIDALAARGKEPVYKAIAMKGEGVLETFLGLLSLTWRHLENEHQLHKKFGIEPSAFVDAVRTAIQAGAPTAAVVR